MFISQNKGSFGSMVFGVFHNAYITHSDWVLQWCVNLCLLEEHIATTGSPQHALKRWDALTVNDTSNKPTFINQSLNMSLLSFYPFFVILDLLL